MSRFVLFLVNPGHSRERRRGEVTSTVGAGSDAVLTIDCDGETFERRNGDVITAWPADDTP